jgi:hypothetical protein
MEDVMTNTMMQQALLNIHEVNVMHDTWIPGLQTTMSWPDVFCLLMYVAIIGWVIIKLVAYVYMIFWSVKNFGLLKTVFLLVTFNKIMRVVDNVQK